MCFGTIALGLESSYSFSSNLVQKRQLMLSVCEILVVAALPSYTWCAHVSIYLVYYHHAPDSARSRSSDLGGLNENLLASAGSTPGVHSPAWLQVGGLVVLCFPAQWCLTGVLALFFSGQALPRGVSVCLNGGAKRRNFQKA